MLKGLLHIEQIKNYAEQGLNWYLSYTTAQPIDFDLAIIALFAMQYFGLNHFININQ